MDVALRALFAGSLLAFGVVACSSTTDCKSGVPQGGPQDGPCLTGTSPTASGVPTGAPTGPTTIPNPSPNHPRLWVRSSDVPRLRGWANPKNPVFVELQKIADKRFLEGDLDNPKTDDAEPSVKTVKQDQGSDIYQADPTSEEYARLFAFLALVSPDAQRRDLYAKKAHGLLMKVIAAAASCPTPKQKGNAVPFCSTGFLLRDRANFQGDAYATVLDWIYPYFSKSDKALVQKAFLGWADELTHAMVTTANHPEPVGVFNAPVLTAHTGKLRWAGNDYFAAHMKNLGLLTLVLDPEDDAPKDPSKPASALGNTVRSYLPVATGAYLYMTDHFYRHGGNQPDPSGAARDFRGSAPEGTLYGVNSLGFAAQLYLALSTAGMDDPVALGPQVRWSDHPHWDNVTFAYFAGLEPSPSLGSSYVGKGTLTQVAAFGEVNYETVTVDPMLLFGPRGVWAYNAGKGEELAQIRYLEKYVPAGGGDHFLTRIQKTPNIHFTLDAIFAFLLFDPTKDAPPLVDPRPSFPLVYDSPGLGRVLARTSAGPEASFFTHKLSWLSIDHQNPDGNQIELYRKGQWLTKGLMGYGPRVALSHHRNTLALENDLPHDTYKGDLTPQHGTLYPSYRRGSQWLHGASGDPEILAKSLSRPGILHLTGDATKLYNLSLNNTSASGVVHASRSLVWLKPDHLIVYDRATSKSEGRFKRFFLNTQTLASITGGSQGSSSGSDADLGPAGSPMNSFSGAVPGGGLLSVAKVLPVAEKPPSAPSPEQLLFLTTLLPSKVTIRASQPEEMGKEPLAVDPMKFLIQVEAQGNPADTRFLHVIQGADAGQSADPVSLVVVNQKDASLSPYEGALVKNTVVLFAKRLGEGFSGMSYPAPKGATQVVTGLPKKSAFSASQDASGKVTVSPGGALMSDEGGVLVF